jgi:hypothetical protein
MAHMRFRLQVAQPDSVSNIYSAPELSDRTSDLAADRSAVRISAEQPNFGPRYAGGVE